MYILKYYVISMSFYYFSNEFNGILSVSKLFAFMYNRLLNDTKNQYKFSYIPFSMLRCHILAGSSFFFLQSCKARDLVVYLVPVLMLTLISTLVCILGALKVRGKFVFLIKGQEGRVESCWLSNKQL